MTSVTVDTLAIQQEDAQSVPIPTVRLAIMPPSSALCVSQATVWTPLHQHVLPVRQTVPSATLILESVILDFVLMGQYTVQRICYVIPAELTVWLAQSMVKGNVIRVNVPPVVPLMQPQCNVLQNAMHFQTVQNVPMAQLESARHVLIQDSMAFEQTREDVKIVPLGVVALNVPQLPFVLNA